MREWHPKYINLNPDAKMKAIARSIAGVYLRRGKITRKPCRICGADAEMHHQDYTKPLDVDWFCRTHHIETHAKEVL